MSTSLFFSALCFLIINIKELSFLAQTETVQYTAKIGIFLCALVTMVLGSATFVAEREELTLESLMTGLVLRSLIFIVIVGGLLLVAYGSISIALSILVSSSKASILISLIILITTAIPAFMSGILQVSAVGKFINQISPISNAFKLMSAILVEKQSQLAPGESVTVEIPIRFMYVGEYELYTSVMRKASNTVISSSPITLIMIGDSNMNPTSVMVVSIVVPAILLLITLVLNHKKRPKKSQ